MTGKPPLDERQQTLLRQAKNCRNLAHFLRTDPRVKNHFDMETWFFSPNNDNVSIYNATLHNLVPCGTTACAIGWAYAIGMPTEEEDYCAGNPIAWDYMFMSDVNRTPQEEALVLEKHAAKLEAQI